jgi:hypothetical protein
MKTTEEKRFQIRNAILKYRHNRFSLRNLLIHLSTLVVTFGVLLTSYLGVSYSESIGSLVEDEWCDPKTQGIGLHCFSDYYSVVEIKNLDSAWSQGSTYPPLAILITRIFSTLESLNLRAGLSLYLLSGLICILIPVIHLAKRGILTTRKNAFSVFVLLVCSGPVISALDRGNNVLFLFPIIYFLYVLTARGNHLTVCVLIAVAALLKPQMLLFYLVPIVNRHFKSFIIGGLGYLFFNSILFLAFPGNFWGNVSQWLGNLQGYQTYPGMPSLGNYSFANSTGLIIGSFKVVAGNSSVGEVFRPGLSSGTVTVLSFSYLVLLVSLLMWRKSKLDPKIQLFIVSFSVITVPGTSFGYYLILLLAPLLFFELEVHDKETKGSEPAEEFGFILNVSSKFTLTLLYISIIPLWPFQWGMLNLNVKSVWNHYGVIPTIVGIFLWMVPLVLVSNKKSSLAA